MTLSNMDRPATFRPLQKEKMYIPTNYHVNLATGYITCTITGVILFIYVFFMGPALHENFLYFV